MRKTELYALSAFLFVLGFCVPLFAQALIYPVLFWVFLNWKGRVVKDYVLQSALLLLFCITYYVISYSYGFIDLIYVIHRPLLFWGLYSLGFYIGQKNNKKSSYFVMLPLLAGVAGFALYVALLFFNITPQQMSEAAASRTIDSFWPGGTKDIATMIGLYISLGLCLAPIPLFANIRKIKKLHYAGLLVLVAFFVAIALFTAILFQDRTPIAALALSFVACFILFFTSRNEGLYWANNKLHKTIIILIGLGVVAFVVMSYVNLGDVFARFANKGLNSPRFAAWLDMLVAIPSHLSGGKTVSLNGLNYVHNTWLDAAYTAGVLPFILLVIFDVMQFWGLYKVLRSDYPLVLRLTMCGLGVSLLTGFFVEPTLNGSAFYFGFGCMFLGFVRSLYIKSRREMLVINYSQIGGRSINY